MALDGRHHWLAKKVSISRRELHLPFLFPAVAGSSLIRIGLVCGVFQCSWKELLIAVEMFLKAVDVQLLEIFDLSASTVEVALL